jgi:hypothetical protein
MDVKLQFTQKDMITYEAPVTGKSFIGEIIVLYAIT